MKKKENIENVIYEKKKIIEVLRELELLVVSLDRIKSEYLGLPDKKAEEEIDIWLVDFIFKWNVQDRLAQARFILDEAFSRKLGDDDMDELEREFQDLQYWSRNKKLPEIPYEFDE